MQAQLVRRTYHWVRVDWISVIGYPVIGVIVISMVGMLAKTLLPMSGWYYAPYAIVIAACSNRVCVRAGVVAAGLSALSHDMIFTPPVWQLSWPGLEMAIGYASGFGLALLVGRKIVHETVVVPRDVGLSESLPFVDKDRGQDQRLFWVVEPSGEWTDDAAVGASYAQVWLHRLAAGTAPPLGWIVRDMIKAGRWSGIEAGFLRMISNVRASISHDHPQNQ